ncbi:MAG: TonB-dependent receptor [Acidobacteria bacterium]|nr:TonB-dependent receptor [Acidobacteriota bacterium]
MRILSAVALLVLLAGAAVAQTFRGTILGTVTDASGAVIGEARVTARNAANGFERSTQTSADGSYTIPELPIGSYTVTVTKAGFQTSTTTDVAVNIAVERRVDAAMKPGNVETTIEVAGESLPQVETTNDTLGGTLTAAAVKDLPVNGRDYTKLIYMTPGIAGSPDQISDSPGSFGIFSMNGARGRSNNFLLDGTDMNDGYRNDPAINEAGVFGTPATILPVDSIGELRVLSNFEPEYGRNAGAVVNIVTKSGTNKLHGAAIEYFRNNALDARNYFNPVGQPQATFHNNQFGGSLGGPIVQNRTFFFLDYEAQREQVGVVTLGCVPDPAQIAADTAAITTGGGSVNPIISALLARHPWPAPNLKGTFGTAGPGEESGCLNGNSPDASVISPSRNRVDSLIGKIDHNFNAGNLLTGRYYFGDSDQSFPLALTASGGQLPGFNTYTPTRVQLVSLSWVHTVSSTRLNELRFGWNRFAEGFFPEDQSFQPSSIGLNTGGGASDQGLPIILIGHFAQLGSTSGDPRHRVDANDQLLDNFSWKFGRHDVRFGAEYRRTTIGQTNGKYARGKLTFDSLTAFLTGTLDTGFGKSFEYLGNSLRHTYENNYGAYVQDTFRASARLTFTYGVRWDYFGVIGEKNNLFSNITATNPAAATLTLAQVGSGGLNQLYQPDYRNFAPRVSAAWDPLGHGKTVIRAGYGVFFDAFSQDFFLGHLPYPPFFDPGPAYNPIGPAQIIPAAALGAIVKNQPVFGAAGCGSVECDIFAVDPHIRTPYMENYNLNLQQQLGSRVALQIGYVGSQGHRLFRFRDINQPSQAVITAADLGAGSILSYGVPRPFGNNPYGAVYIMREEAAAKSNYNALQMNLRTTPWHGMTTMANYTWSHSLDTASDGEDFEPNAAQPNDSTRPNLEYGNSNFDLRQRFSWILSYELPHLGGRGERFKNGWGLSSTATLQSGQPFQFNYNFEDDFSGSGEGFDRPDVVGPVVYHPRNPANYVDLTAFAIPCTVNVAAATGTASDCIPGTRRFGNLGRDALVGPNFRQWDLALYKNTNLNERVSMQLRAEAFNVLNRPNFANPFLPLFIADPGSNGFQLKGNREVGVGGYQLTATGDVGIGNPFLGGGGPRGIQLAVKFSF